MALASGFRLGSYEILTKLGEGGMGEVYRARDSRLGREVALKVLPPDVTGDASRLERFDREARAIAALNHPHIVTIYSNEDVDGLRFLTMELVEGQTLTELIVSGGVAVSRFLELALQLADALSAAHQKQITHRDLKPGNVMVTRDGRVKVLDFGLARMGDTGIGEQSIAATQAPITHVGMIVGTIPYMSPEQIEGRPIDPRSDLFSLGVIFYELLKGERPFKGDSSPALMSAILRDTPSRISDARADVPEPVARLIARCLEKRPEDRVQTARDVFNELRHIQRELESGVRATSAGRPAAVKPEPAGPSIAVLPFSDLSATKDQDWFCDGIAEEILNALSHLPGLRVAARASTFSLRGQTHDLRTVGQKLNVQSVLEGSVRRAGDRVRITTQLSDVEQGRQLWSERFDRELKDIFEVQEEIARAIVDRLEGTLFIDADRRLVNKATDNLDAYQLLLKGRVLLLKRGHAIFDAMSCFEQAIALDPRLSEAHALLADALRLMGLYGLIPETDIMPRARAAAERALEIDPRQVEALATLANIAAVYDWDIAAALAMSDRALAINPTHVRALAERVIVLTIADIPPDALQTLVVESVGRARELDPLNAWVAAVEAFCQTFIGHLPEALAAAERSVALDENNFTARWAQTFTLAAAGRNAEAEQAAAPALAMSDRHPRILAELAAMHAANGEAGQAEAIHQELNERARKGYVGSAARAAVAASAGHFDEARTLVAQAIAARDSYLTFWKLPAWRPFWTDAGCANLLRNTSLFRSPTGV